LFRLLNQETVLMLPQQKDTCSVRLVVPQENLAAVIDAVNRTFFSDVDPLFFAPAETAAGDLHLQKSLRTAIARERRMFNVQTGWRPLRGFQS
jgi:hypothetical protein